MTLIHDSIENALSLRVAPLFHQSFDPFAPSPTCVARAACFGFCSALITTFLFSFFFFYKFNRHLCDGDIRVALLICLFSSSFGISFFVINGYVCVSLYTHFPSLPYLCTFIAIFICIYASTILY